MGYAETSQRGEGIHLRQFARAFIIQDNAGRRVAYISAEIAGISAAMRRDVSSSTKAKIIPKSLIFQLLYQTGDFGPATKIWEYL